MKKQHALEMEYAKRLRSSTHAERRTLYEEAYSAVSESALAEMPGEIEKRTAGTSPRLVNLVIRRCRPTDRVLEVGCGRGYTCLKLAPHVRSLVGLDISRRALEETRGLLEANTVGNVSLVNGSADELTRHFPPRTFDKVVSIDVYEHLVPEDAKTHLSQVYTVLKPKGRLIVVTPNRLTGPHDITRKLFPGHKEPLGFHLNETTCAELVRQLKQAGFVKFSSVLPLSSVLRVPLDIIYPSSLYSLMERLFSKWLGSSAGGGFIDRLSSIILIAGKG
jgi:SAM-dependent methyltransferase